MWDKISQLMSEAEAKTEDDNDYYYEIASNLRNKYQKAWRDFNDLVKGNNGQKINKPEPQTESNPLQKPQNKEVKVSEGILNAIDDYISAMEKVYENIEWEYYDDSSFNLKRFAVKFAIKELESGKSLEDAEMLDAMKDLIEEAEEKNEDDDDYKYKIDSKLRNEYQKAWKYFNDLVGGNKKSNPLQNPQSKDIKVSQDILNAINNYIYAMEEIKKNASLKGINTNDLNNEINNIKKAREELELGKSLEDVKMWDKNVSSNVKHRY